MADNFDSPSFNFGIENTMEMGMGNAELLSDLLGSETATSNPEDLEPIVKEVEPVAPTSKKAAPKTVIPKEPEEEVANQDLIAGFLEESEETETETKPIKEEKVNEEEDDDEPTSQFSALSRDLLRLGVFTNDEDAEDVEIKTPEEFLERFKAAPRI